MKPLMFKYRKLGELGLQLTDNLEYTCGDVIAYQVFPKGDYSEPTNITYKMSIAPHSGNSQYTVFNDCSSKLKIDNSNPMEPFLVFASDWEQFKQAVIEYNRKYCDQPDVKVLDDLVAYVKKESSGDRIETTNMEYWTDRFRRSLEPEYFEEIE